MRWRPKKSGENSQARQLFRGLLGREPDRKELVLLASQLKLHGNLEPLARDLVMSKEFSIQVLPQLVANWSANFRDKRVFFLHVPKTAGTSVRLAIGEALGLPSLLLYGGFIRPQPSASFWPYWAGHVGIPIFPTSHEGFTVFRETRSRMLSHYRQAQKKAGPAPRVPMNRQSQIRVAPPPPIDFWRGNHGLDSWYLLDQQGRTNELGRANEALLQSLSLKEKLAALERGLKRIQYASWVHDHGALLKSINQLTGATLDSLPRENTFEGRKEKPQEIRLSKQDMQVLNEMVERDKPVLDISVSLGIIPRLDKQTSDDLFVDAAKRLGFVLP